MPQNEGLFAAENFLTSMENNISGSCEACSYPMFQKRQSCLDGECAWGSLYADTEVNDEDNDKFVGPTPNEKAAEFTKITSCMLRSKRGIGSFSTTLLHGGSTCPSNLYLGLVCQQGGLLVNDPKVRTVSVSSQSTSNPGMIKNQNEDTSHREPGAQQIQ